jgi:K+-sensing histidine kinase KdpD
MDSDAATIAVMAHGLLGAVGVISGAATMLKGRHERLSPDKREELLVMIIEQAGLLAGVLQDLMRGLPVDQQRKLEALAARRPHAIA